MSFHFCCKNITKTLLVSSGSSFKVFIYLLHPYTSLYKSSNYMTSPLYNGDVRFNFVDKWEDLLGRCFRSTNYF